MDAPLTPLPRGFFARDVLEVARDLLGRVVRHRTAEGVVAVRLTEVEAYAGEADPGSHAFRGRTPRTEVMFGPPGHAYVYFSYGVHWCVNLVTGAEGTASAVLLRAGEVVEGAELARSRRPAARRDADLARGPARLTQSLAITGEQGGADVCSGGSLEVLEGSPVPDAAVSWGPRVGVAGPGAPTPWRAWATGEPTVSTYRAAVPRRPRRP
ncbi:DNA-3-methyladenine glycosylase [Kineococcus indalonis]|uniref:DNA-3-methyladenine glycosylase n=1 Tax=Kineococcus indalonis TaxID=2696566 RepID=UPI0014123D5B|nr:DNA-3-methyladenine glycosylase [Kineococcus indalonis]NAZ85307.1 DNA-3-methyladenine glycosylase [Kineococcus indalonis]